MKHLKPITQRGVLFVLSALGFLFASFGATWAHGRVDGKEPALRNGASNATEPSASHAVAKNGSTIKFAGGLPFSSNETIIGGTDRAMQRGSSKFKNTGAKMGGGGQLGLSKSKNTGMTR